MRESEKRALLALTVAEAARRAGVSRGAMYRYLADAGSVRAYVRARIEKLACELARADDADR